jgi:hypothetical protein
MVETNIGRCGICIRIRPCASLLARTGRNEGLEMKMKMKQSSDGSNCPSRSAPMPMPMPMPVPDANILRRSSAKVPFLRPLALAFRQSQALLEGAVHETHTAASGKAKTRGQRGRSNSSAH